MNKKIIKQLLTMTILLLFCMGMFIGAADAAHAVKKGKYSVKISDKEYDKLNSYETKYKTVTKTRNVTKTKEVAKTKQVVKTETKTENRTAFIFRDNFTLYNNDTGHYEKYELTGNESEHEIELAASTGYTLVSSNVTYYSIPRVHFWCMYNRNYRVTNLTSDLVRFDFSHCIGTIKMCFEKNTTYTENQKYVEIVPYNETEKYTEIVPYNETEKYTEIVPYNETEKYTEKVPYKVRKNVEILKTVPNKCVYAKKTTPIVKTVKVKASIWANGNLLDSGYVKIK